VPLPRKWIKLSQLRQHAAGVEQAQLLVHRRSGGMVRLDRADRFDERTVGQIGRIVTGHGVILIPAPVPAVSPREIAPILRWINIAWPAAALVRMRSGTYIERMAQLDTREKLAILADAAKYDASCASSGTAKRDSRDGKGLGSTEGMGICHAYAPDGRCISLLKILLTNSCIFDCHYCINRKSSNVRRARFTAAEVVRLTLSFYRRNYIEGLFLSSGIIRSSNYTMEQMVEVARSRPPPLAVVKIARPMPITSTPG